MSATRSLTRWLLLVVVALATVAMHTQLSGGCPHPGNDTPAMTAAPAAAMAAIAAPPAEQMPEPEHAALVTAPRSVTAAGPVGPGGSGMGAGMGQVCQATAPPTPVALALALAAVVLAMLFLGPPTPPARRWWWARRWWPPPVRRSALGIWRI